MTRRTKIILIGIGIFLVVLVLAFFVTKFFSGENNTLAPGSSNGITVAHMDADGKFFYFDSRDKILYQSINNQKQAVFIIGYDPVAMIFSPDAAKVLVVGDIKDFGVPIRIIDVASRKAIELDPDILNIAVSPDSKKLAYHFFDEETKKSGLYTSTISNLNQKEIFDFGTDTSEDGAFYAVRWLTNEQVLFFPMYAEVSTADLKLLDVTTNQIQTIASRRFIDALPSLQGDSIATLVEDESSPSPELSSLEILDLAKTSRITGLFTDSKSVVWKRSESVLYAVAESGQQERYLYEISDLGRSVKVITSVPLDWKIDQVLLSGDNNSVIVVHSGALEYIHIQNGN